MHFVVRRGPRECLVTRYPYTVVHRVGPRRIESAQVDYPRAEYFQRGR